MNRSTRSHLVTKIAAAALLAGVATGVLAGPAAAAGRSDAPQTDQVSSQTGHTMNTFGFGVTNLTPYTLKLTGITGDNSFEARPANGTFLRPGQTQGLQVIAWAFTIQQNTLHYDVLDDHGKIVGHAAADLTVDYPGAGPSAAARIDAPGTAPSTNRTTGRTGVVFAPDAAEVTLDAAKGDGANAQAMANVLKQICDDDVEGSTCSFDAYREERTALPARQIGAAVENTTHENGTSTEVGFEDEVGQSNTVGAELKVGSKLFGIIETEITGKYEHEWTTEHTFKQKVTIEVPARTRVWVTDAAPVVAHTGNFTVTLGGTTWHLQNVTFHTPDPDGNPVWQTHSQSLDGGAETVARVR